MYSPPITPTLANRGISIMYEFTPSGGFTRFGPAGERVPRFNRIH
jgi:hypothetical protein